MTLSALSEAARDEVVVEWRSDVEADACERVVAAGRAVRGSRCVLCFFAGLGVSCGSGEAVRAMLVVGERGPGAIEAVMRVLFEDSFTGRGARGVSMDVAFRADLGLVTVVVGVSARAAAGRICEEDVRATFGMGSVFSNGAVEERTGAPTLFGRALLMRARLVERSSAGEMGFMRRPLTAAEVPCAVRGRSARISSPFFATLPSPFTSPFSKGMLLFFSTIMLLLLPLSPVVFVLPLSFSAFSASDCTVVPPIARFSSGMGLNLMIPRSAGTLRISAMKPWINAALRLFIVGPICEVTELMVRL